MASFINNDTTRLKERLVLAGSAMVAQPTRW